MKDRFQYGTVFNFFVFFEFLILFGRHLANFRAVVHWFFLPSGLGTFCLLLFCVGIVASEWKIHSFSKKVK